MAKKQSRVGRAIRPVIQSLEARTLLSAAGNDGGALWVIYGDASRRHPNDSILVDVDPANASRLRATINSKLASTHAVAGLTEIQVGAGRGDDRVSIEVARAVPNVSVRVWGGYGNDVLLGDSGSQAFYAGGGNDRIDAGGGDDSLCGDAGNDDLMGGDGNDWESGNAGNDSLSGGWGMDRLLGNEGTDQIDGGEGRDKLDGGDNRDILKGGAGFDALKGGEQLDYLYIDGRSETTDKDPNDRVRVDGSKLLLDRVSFDDLRQKFREAAIAQWENSFDQNISGYGWPYPVIYNDSIGAPAFLASAGTMSGQSASFSKTNTQELGVDEADLVETDGDYLYSIAGQKLVITDASTLQVVSRREITGQAVGLYLIGNRLTVISSDTEVITKPLPPGVTLPTDPPPYIGGGPGTIQLGAPAVFSSMPVRIWRLPTIYNPTVTLTVLDISHRDAPQVVEETKLDGTYVSSRAIGDRVYAVVQNNLQAPIPDLIKVDDHTVKYESKESYIAHLDGGWLDDALPGYTGTAGGATSSGLLVGNGYDFAREGFSNIMDQSTLTVALLNVADNLAEPLASTSVAGWGGQVYASADALYLAQSHQEGVVEKSDLFKFSLGADAVALTAGGQVEGHVLNQFSMDEEGQYFRIATTEGWGTGASNNVFVLHQVGDELRTIGSIESIADGESLFAARFIGDRGYLITYQRVDPLFTLDLSDPTNPKIAGELVIPGFSNYLHPIDETHLVGLGSDAQNNVQLSLFDISDIANPKCIDVYDVTAPASFSTSPAQNDHHAFSYFPELGILAFPVSDYSSDTGYTPRLEVVRISPRKGFTPLGSVKQEGGAIRSVQINDRLFSVGDQVIKVVNIEDPAEELGVIDLVDGQ